MLQGGRRAFSDTGDTEVLRGAPGADVCPRGGNGANGYRPAGKPDAWSAFDRSPARKGVTFPDPGHDAPAASGTAAYPASAATTASAVRDPWAESAEAEESGRPGATHDPHEVTIQLDGVGLQLDHVLRAAKDAPGGGEGSDGPVFVDESGRRSRRFRRIGMAVGLACAVYAVVIVATLLSGNSDAPWLPVERPKQRPAGQVDIPPLPAESAPQPSGTGDVSPGTSLTAGTGTTPSADADADADATTPDASAGAEEPGASVAPKPTATKNTEDPGTDPTPDPDPPTEPATPDPDPTPTDGGGPTEGPTDTPTTDVPAGGTVANGPSDPTPIAQDPDASAPAPAAPSPEYSL